MKIVNRIAGTPTPFARDAAAATPSPALAPGGWAKGLSRRLASLRAAFTGGRPASSRPPVGRAAQPARPGPPKRPLPAIPARRLPPLPPNPHAPATPARPAPAVVEALRPPSQEALAAKWTARIGAAAQQPPYLGDLAASRLSPRAASAVTELTVAMAQAKMRDDIAQGFVPDLQDRLTEVRYLGCARSVVMAEFRTQADRHGEAAACGVLRRHAQVRREARPADTTRKA